MSARIVVDSSVIEPLPASHRPIRQPGQGFFDAATPQGIRVLGVVEPTGSDPKHCRAIAYDIIRAVEAEIDAISDGSADAAARRVFTAANWAARAYNHRIAGTDPLRRTFAGLTVAVLDGERLLIGLVAPGQSLVIQRGEVFAFPSLAGGCDDAHTALASGPLGMFPEVAPSIFSTMISDDDCVILAGSGLSERLGGGEIDRLLDGAAERLDERLEQILNERAFAGDVVCARIGDLAPLAVPEPAASVPAPSEADKEPVLLYEGAGRQTIAHQASPEFRFDQWHTKMIEASERWFARRPPKALPLHAEARQTAAMGAGSVRRYRPRHAVSLEMRSYFPRCSQVPVAGVMALMTLALVLGGVGFGYNTRQVRASKQDSYLASVESRFGDAMSAGKREDKLTFLAEADGALHSAEKNGADAAVTAQWRGKIAALTDSVNGIHRFSSFSLAGSLPAELAGAPVQLVQAGGRFFIVAGSAYQVDASGARLATLLSPGATIDGRTAGQLVDAAVDGEELVVSNGRSLFRWNAKTSWTAAPLPATSPGDVWTSAIHGAYLGNYYLLDANEGQILKFAKGQTGGAPIGWLDAADRPALSGAVDMALDGSIRVLLKDGSIQSFFMGKAEASMTVSSEPAVATEVGIDGGAGMSNLYVLERSGKTGRLIRVNPQNGAMTPFLTAERGQPGYDADAANALVSATDFAVDEAGGSVAFISDSQIWFASLGT